MCYDIVICQRGGVSVALTPTSGADELSSVKWSESILLSHTLKGLNGWFVQSAPVDSGFAGDPTSLACNNINLSSYMLFCPFAV